MIDDTGRRPDAADPIYRALIDSPAAAGILAEDRHLFACLLALADREAAPLNRALGLSNELLERLIRRYFPRLDSRRLFTDSAQKLGRPYEINLQVQELLLSYVPADVGSERRLAAEVLARVIAVRAAHPGHLWVAMGLFERPQLSAAIGRHLPLLLAANNKGMRWKIFLFKQVCELNGGRMCKSPDCGSCSDYELCFAPEDE